MPRGSSKAARAEMIVSGGANACVTPGMMFGICRMRAIATGFNDRPKEASRPFDSLRQGFVLGEGAWIVARTRSGT